MKSFYRLTLITGCNFLILSCGGDTARHPVTYQSNYNQMKLLHVVNAISTSEALGENSRHRIDTLLVLVEYKKNISNQIGSDYYLYSKKNLKKIKSSEADALFYLPYDKRVYLSIEYVNGQWCGLCDGISFLYENNIVTKLIDPD